MGRRKRLHRQAVIAGTEKPHRTGPDKHKPEPASPDKSAELLERALKMAGIPGRRHKI